jgi:serine beta-lactamase-like protein LACTB
MRPRVAALALVTGLVAPAQAELPPAKVVQIEQLVTAFRTLNQIPGMSIAVVADGELAWSGSYGLADAENGVPARPTTAYRSASIGKPLTATAAMRLVEAGALDLDADIRRYCPAFPAKRWPITTRHLLTHTSGIRHYGGPNDEAEQLSTVHYESVVAALAPFRDDALLFEPGTRWGYSTYGYGVLGCVVEGAAGVPFLDAMESLVWGPAGMTATRDDDPAPLVPERAAKYTLAGGRLRNAPAIDMSNRLAAGGYLTNVLDLARFAASLLGGRLVSARSLDLMTTSAKLPSGELTGYGLGWAVEPEPWHGDRWAFHGGSSPGASGFLAVMPRHRFAVVFLANLDELEGRSELAEDIARIVLDFPPRPPEPPAGAPES